MSENQKNDQLQEEVQEQDINILKKDRLDKLASLREGGYDPYQVTKFDVTGKAAELKAEYEKKESELKAAAGDLSLIHI